MKPLVTTVFCGLLCFSATAQARDLSRQNYLLGERASSMGGAFVSLTGDPASTYYNPAGLAALHKRGLSLSASAYQLRIERYKNLLDLNEGGIPLRIDMKSSTFGTFPSSIIYVLPLGKKDNKKGKKGKGSVKTVPPFLRHVVAMSVLVPDYDKLVALIDKPAQDLAFELKGKYFLEEMTYWIGPSYAISIGDRVRLGMSVFCLLHMAEIRTTLGFKQSFDTGTNDSVTQYFTNSSERSAMGLTMLAQVGVQVDIARGFSLGLTLRTPTFGTFWSKVSLLEMNSYLAEQADGTVLDGVVDRIETKKVKLHYRLPLMVALGVSYDNKRSFAIGLDFSFQVKQSAFKLYEGHVVFPRDADGNEIIDATRAINPEIKRQNTWVYNVNLGTEFALSKKVKGRAGLFTDLSAVDQRYYRRSETGRMEALILPRLTRLGVSLGVGWRGKRGSTSIGVNYVIGFGNTFGINEIFALEDVSLNRVDVMTHTLTVVLSGSADL